VSKSISLLAIKTTLFRAHTTHLKEMPMKTLMFALTLVLAKSINAGESHLTKANNKAGLSIYLELQKNAQTNTFYSPISTSQALTLLLAGTTGATETNLLQSLGYSGLSVESILDSSASELNALTENADPAKGLSLSVSNSIWADKKSIQFRDDFLKTVKTKLSAEAKVLDFKAPGASNEINAWANEKTKGKIPQVLDDETLSSRAAILMNATYFNGNWTYPFPKDSTHDDSFSGLKSILKISMMSNGREGESLRYIDKRKYKAIELPYGQLAQSQPASMFVILPFHYEDFMAFANPDLLQQIIEETKKTEPQRVSLELPKFSFKSEYDLVPSLKKAGISGIFVGSKDFEPMVGDGDFAVDLIKQNTIVSVDEKGTEAAAATVIGIGVTSAIIRPALAMRVDSPFLVVIKSNTTGSILFVGSVVDPSKK
jgi:serine protease inhibitor